MELRNVHVPMFCGKIQLSICVFQGFIKKHDSTILKRITYVRTGTQDCCCFTIVLILLRFCLKVILERGKINVRFTDLVVDGSFSY